MSTVLRCYSLDLPSVTLDFSDEEVDTVSIMPKRKERMGETQAGDVKIWFRGGVHYEFGIRFRVARYNTLLKLWELFNLEGDFTCYPHFPSDTVTNYTVVWMNADAAFVAKWRRGYPRANYTIDVLFREPRGENCFPPT